MSLRRIVLSACALALSAPLARAQTAEPLPPPPVYAPGATDTYYQPPQQAQPPQQPVYGQPPVFTAPGPAYTPSAARPAPRFRPQLGLGARVVGAWSNNGLVEYSQGGASVDLLLRASRYVTTEASLQYLRVGVDRSLYDRTDVPFLLGLRVHLAGPRSVVAPYFAFAGGGTWARLDLPDVREEAWYVAGQLGGGLEVRIGRHFAITADIRGVGKARVGDGPRLVSTDLYGEERELMGSQVGFIGTLGAAGYF
jgi:hypothetical protein